MISIINVPNIPHAASSTPVVLFAESDSDCAVHAFHSNCIFIPPNSTIFSVVAFSGSAESRITLLITLFGFHIMVTSLHQGSFLIFVSSHFSVGLAQFGSLLDTAFIIISPNDSVSHTIAGTNASPMNSLIVKLSSSHPIRFDPATKRKVKSGANIAYIQSLIALTRSIVTRAKVRSPNTKNIIDAIMP